MSSAAAERNGPASLVSAAHDDGSVATEIVNGAAAAISRAASVLVAAVDPGLVILGGGVAAAWGNDLADRVACALPARICAGANAVVQISDLGDQAALIGAAQLARESF